MQKMPHLKIPIGTKNGKMRLEGLFDTGGCSTIGYRPYFMAMKKYFPQLVRAVHTLKQHRHADISINGIGGGIEITDIMEIKLPYKSPKGHQACIAIGLAEETPITLIIGLPFIINTGCIMDYDKTICHSSVFNDDWRFTMKPAFRKHASEIEEALETPPGQLAILHTHARDPNRPGGLMFERQE